MTLNPTSGPEPLRVPAFTRGERLRKAREEKGLTQAQLAEQTGIGLRYIIDYENGKRDVKSDGHFVLWEWATRAPAVWLKDGIVPSGPNLDPSHYKGVVTRMRRPISELAHAESSRSYELATA